MKKYFIVLAAATMLASCAHHRDVRPGASGVHRVKINSAEKDAASRDAISQANHFCEERGQSAAFIDERSNYTGSMDEQTYKNTQTASRVAKTVGGTVAVFGGRNESNLGKVVGLGGVAGEAALGQGYTLEMSFKCI